MKNIKLPTNRNFGIVFFIVFLIISLYPLINSENIRLWSLIISLCFLILGIMNSSFLTPFNKIWMRFGAILGKIISPIVMGFIYFFVVTPIGILLRLINKDILKLKNNNDNTYWIKKDNTNSSMNNQF
tara:strand:+ start:627 stop:1010 length:384 start_codon:yes stop_codon:yes gene_type:complete